MPVNENFDVIIIGGSHAGLQAGLTFGRALKKVLIIDSGAPCNRQTPHSHNFLTRDGETPAALLEIAKDQLAKYPTVSFYYDKAAYGMRYNNGFEIGTLSGKAFTAKKLLFASGIYDVMAGFDGFAECWGISVLHCPYCHGYEIKNFPTGILANGDVAFDLVKLISNWTEELTLFTNGEATLKIEQIRKLKSHGVNVVEKEIKEIAHRNGYVHKLLFNDGGESTPIKALYTRLPFKQHCHIPAQLGCAFTADGYILVDAFGKTTIDGIYAAGDNCTPMRSIATAVYGGMLAAATMNREMIDEMFK